MDKRYKLSVNANLSVPRNRTQEPLFTVWDDAAKGYWQMYVSRSEAAELLEEWRQAKKKQPPEQRKVRL